MYRMTGKLNGKGHRKYVVTLYAEDYQRIKTQGTYSTTYGVWCDLSFEYIEKGVR